MALQRNTSTSSLPEGLNLQPDRLFQIVAVDATNAHHVGTVFRSLYGDDFPVEDVYHPEVLSKEIQAGRLISGLAFDREGRAAGYISLFKPAPNPRLWEAASLLVVPGYSHTDVSSRLVRYCLDVAMRRTADIDGIFCEAVCCHYFSQVVLAKNGLIDCGLVLDQLDGASFKDGKSNKAGSCTRFLCTHFRGSDGAIGDRIRPRPV